MKDIVICGGLLLNKDIILDKIDKEYNKVIAVDSGYNNAILLGLKPNIIIGDLDSIKEYDNNIELIQYNPIKDDTDIKLALDYCINKYNNNIDIICATGNRIDHLLNNISMLSYLKDKGIKARILDEYNIISILDEYNEINNISKYVSIIPISDYIIYSSTNLYYKANKLRVNRVNIMSISNQAIKDKFSIKIHKGEALLIQSN